jgi:ABC-2 type transport system permease protein
MLGLLKKDLLVLKSQKFYVVLTIFLILSLFIGNEEPIFGVLASSMLVSMFSITTIAYDDHNNSRAFLLTLPITRKTYAIEKYLLSFCSCIFICVISGIIFSVLYPYVIMPANIVSWVIQILFAILAPNIIVSLLIPVNLKFGSERGRIVMIILFVLFGILSPNLSNGTSLGHMHNLINFITQQPLWVLLIGFALINLIITLISIIISIKIIELKEF